MHTWAFFYQFCILVLALLAGMSMATQGVISASASVKCGAFSTCVFNRVIVADFAEIHAGKIYYKLAIIAPVGR